MFNFNSQVSSTTKKVVTFESLPGGAPSPSPASAVPTQAPPSAGPTADAVNPKLMPEVSAVGVTSPPEPAAAHVSVPILPGGTVDTNVNGFIGKTTQGSSFETRKIGEDAAPHKQTEDSVDDASVLKPWCEEWLKTCTDIKALEILISQRVNPSAVELMLSRGSELRKQVIHAISYFAPPSDTSAAVVLKGFAPLRLGDTISRSIPGGSEGTSFCMTMSWLLGLDELQTVLVVQEAATKMRREITGLTSSPWSYSAVESLYIARDVYFAQRNCILRVITELLRIMAFSSSISDGTVTPNNDFSYSPYQGVVQAALDDMEREEGQNSVRFRVEGLLDQLEALSIAVAPQQSYSQLMGQLPWLGEKDATEFLASHREKWAGQRLVDMSQLVEALIFSCCTCINQRRMLLPLSIAKRVLSLLVAIQSERCIHATQVGVFRVLCARLTVLAVGTIQLSRFNHCYTGGSDSKMGPPHPPSSEDNYNGLEELLLMLKGISRNCDRSSGVPVVLMAGGILLHLGSAFRPDIVTDSYAMAGRQFIQEANDYGCIPVMESLLEILHPSNDAKGDNHTLISSSNNNNTTPSWFVTSASHSFEIYSVVLSELLNVLLVSLYGGCETKEVQLPPLDASGLGPLSMYNVRALCSLAARIYIGNPRLCNAFWKSVSKMEKARQQQSDECQISVCARYLVRESPMGFLLNALLDVAPTLVSPLFHLLSATVFDSTSANHAFSLLSGSGGGDGVGLGKKNSGSVLVHLPLNDRGVSWEFLSYDPNKDVGTICLLRDWDSLIGIRGILVKGGESGIVGKYLGVVMGDSGSDMNCLVAQFEQPVCIWSAAVSTLAHGSEEDRVSVLRVMSTIFRHLPSALNSLSSLLLRWSMTNSIMEHFRIEFERAEEIAFSLGGLNLKDIGAMTRTELMKALNMSRTLGEENAAAVHNGRSNSSREEIHVTEAHMHVLEWFAARPLPLKDGHVFFHEQLVSLLLEIVVAGLLNPSPSSVPKCKASCSALDLLAVLCNSKCSPWPDAVEGGLEQNDAVGGGLFDAPGGKSIVEALCHCVDTLTVSKNDSDEEDTLLQGDQYSCSSTVSQQQRNKMWRHKVRLSLLRLAGGILNIHSLGKRYSHLHCLLTLQDVTEKGCVALEQLRVALYESGYKLSPPAFRMLCANLPCSGNSSTTITDANGLSGAGSCSPSLQGGGGFGLVGYQQLLATTPFSPCLSSNPVGEENEVNVAMELNHFLDSVQKEKQMMKGKPLSNRGLRNKEVFLALAASSLSFCEEGRGIGSSVVLLALHALGIFLTGEEIKCEIGASHDGHSNQIIEGIVRDSSLIHLIVSLAVGVGMESDMMSLGCCFSNKEKRDTNITASSAVMLVSQNILLRLLQVSAWAPGAISMALAQPGFGYGEPESGNDFKQLEYYTNAMRLSLQVRGALTGTHEKVKSGLFAVKLFTKLLKRGQATNLTDAIGPESCHLLASMLLTALDGGAAGEEKNAPRAPEELQAATMEFWATAMALQPPALASMLLAPLATTTSRSHFGNQETKSDILVSAVSRIFHTGQGGIEDRRTAKSSDDGRFQQPPLDMSPRFLLYALDFLQALWMLDEGDGRGPLSEVREKLGGRIDGDTTEEQEIKTKKYKCCISLLKILENDVNMVMEDDDEGSIKDHCLCLSLHSRALKLLAFRMHANPEAVELIRKSSAVSSNFAKWMTRYTTLSLINSVTASRSVALANKCGIDLSSFRQLLPQSFRIPGDDYFYSVDALRWLGYRDTEVEDIVKRVNRNWSLMDTQLEAVAAWGSFLEVCIIPRRGLPHSVVDGGVIDAPPLSTATSSKFEGDMQSFSVMCAMADKLKSEKRSEEPAVIVTFCTELSTIMTSMLHHQMKEVVHKAAIPSRTILQSRPNSHLGPNVCADLLGKLSDAMDHLFVLAAPPRVSLSSCATFRLRLLTAVTLLIRATLAECKRSSVGQGGGDSHVPKLSGTGLRIFRHTCDVLALLQVSGGWNWSEEMIHEQQDWRGAGPSIGGSQVLKGGGRESLLSICVALIMELSEMWNVISRNNEGTEAFGEVRRIKEVKAWCKVGHNVIPILLRHYKEGAKQAGLLYEQQLCKVKGSKTKRCNPPNLSVTPSQVVPPPWADNALSSVTIILDFFVSAANSNLFLGNLVVHSVLDELSCCPLICTLATKHTSSRRKKVTRNAAALEREHDNNNTVEKSTAGATTPAVLLVPQQHRGYGYDGEPCPFWRCWRSALSLAAGILHNVKLTALPTTMQYSSHTFGSLWKSALLQALKFIAKHKVLINDGLTLGLLHHEAATGGDYLSSIRSTKFTILILEEQLAISSLLAEASVEMTNWRCCQPELCTSMIECVRYLVRNIAVLLGDGGIGGGGATIDKHKSIEQQEVLTLCCIPVSSSEKQEAGLEKPQALWGSAAALQQNILGSRGVVSSADGIVPPPYLLGRIHRDGHTSRIIFATHLKRLMCQILVPALQFLHRATPDANPFVKFSPSEAVSITIERGSIVQLRPECDFPSIPPAAAAAEDKTVTTTAIIRDYFGVGVDSSYVVSILANGDEGDGIGSLPVGSSSLPPIKIAAAIVPKWRIQAVRDEGAVQPLLAYTPPQRLHCPPSANFGLAGPAFREDPSIGHIIMLCKFAVAYAAEIRELPDDPDILSLSEKQFAICMAVGSKNEQIRDLALICEMGLWLLMDVRLHNHPPSEMALLMQRSLTDLFDVHLDKESMLRACIDASYVESVKQALSSHVTRSSHYSTMDVNCQ